VATAAPATATAQLAEERTAAFWLYTFLGLEIACQLAVISPLGSLRTLLRVASFGVGLAYLLVVRGSGGAHPARPAALAAIAVLAVNVFHPTSNSLLAATAQLMLYVAVLSPLFWVPRLQVGTRHLQVLLLTLWAYHTVGASLGVLQVYFPGRFDPPISPVIIGMGRGYLDGLMITTNTGLRVLRPMGLTDVPGGAASSGLYAVVLGLGVFLTARSRKLAWTAIASILLGLMCLYLAQVRALLVMTGISVIGVSAVLGARRDFRRLGSFAIVLALLAVVSFRSAVSLARESVEQRVGSLAQGTPTQVYARNRGQFLNEAFNTLLPEYPLGAGMGRWGMMNAYFGDKSDPSKSLWAEIQWTGWILDGGIPLVLTYVGALLVTLWTTFRVARWRASGDASLSLWSTVILGYSIGAVAWTFSYPVFLSQTGMEFWLLSACVYAAARTLAWRDAWRRWSGA
jgi:hypothetical protein